MGCTAAHLFDLDHAPGLGGGHQQVRLAAEEGGDLDDVGDLRRWGQQVDGAKNESQQRGSRAESKGGGDLDDVGHLRGGQWSSGGCACEPTSNATASTGRNAVWGGPGPPALERGRQRWAGVVVQGVRAGAHPGRKGLVYLATQRRRLAVAPQQHRPARPPTLATGSACQLSWMSVMTGTPYVSFTFCRMLRAGQQQGKEHQRLSSQRVVDGQRPDLPRDAAGPPGAGAGQAGSRRLLASSAAGRGLPAWDGTTTTRCGRAVGGGGRGGRGAAPSPQALLHAGAAEGRGTGAVGLVEGALEHQLDAQAVCAQFISAASRGGTESGSVGAGQADQRLRTGGRAARQVAHQ